MSPSERAEANAGARAKLQKSLANATLALNIYNDAASNSTSKKKFDLIRKLQKQLGRCSVYVNFFSENLILDEVIVISEIERTLATASSWLEKSHQLNLQNQHGKKSIDNIVGDVSAGMNAFRFGTRLDGIMQPTKELFEKRNHCELSEWLNMTPLVKKFYFSNDEKANRFKDSVLGYGLHFAMENVYDEYCSERKENDKTTCEMTALIIHVYPVRSYKINRNCLTFNEASTEKLKRIVDLASAHQFLDEYGSHVSLDLNQTGGIMCRYVKIRTVQEPLPARLLERYANEIVDQQIAHLKFQPNGYSEILKSNQENKELSCCYYLENVGPLVAQPELFERLLEMNAFGLPTIERDYSSLVGIWELIEDLRPSRSAHAAVLLRKAWLEKVSLLPDNELLVVQRETMKVQLYLQFKHIVPNSLDDIAAEESAISSKVDGDLMAQRRISESTKKTRTPTIEKNPAQKNPSPKTRKDSSSDFEESVRNELDASVGNDKNSPREICEIRDLSKGQRPSGVCADNDEVSNVKEEIVKQSTNWQQDTLETTQPVTGHVISERTVVNASNNEVETSLGDNSLFHDELSFIDEESLNRIKPHEEALVEALMEEDMSNNSLNEVVTYSQYQQNLVHHSSITDLKIRFLMLIRRRLPFCREEIFHAGKQNMTTGSNAQRGKKADTKEILPCSLYELLLQLTASLDAPKIIEIFHILLERQFLIPLINTFTRESYAHILKCVSVPRISPDSISLADDINTSRVAFISCRHLEETQAPLLIESLFNVNTFHGSDLFSAGSARPSDNLAFDVGMAHLKSNEHQSKEQRAILLYTAGDYERVIDFLRDYVDHLIVEDDPDRERSILQWTEDITRTSSKTTGSPLADIPHVTIWKPTTKSELSWEAPKENFHLYGPDYVSVEAPLGDLLVSFLLRILKPTLCKDIEEKSFKPATSRRSMADLSASLQHFNTLKGPPDHDQFLNTSIRKTRESLALERICRQENDYNILHNPSDNTQTSLMNYEVTRTKLREKRELTATSVLWLPIIRYFMSLLEIKDPCSRILALDSFEQMLIIKTKNELENSGERVDSLYAAYVKSLRSKTDASLTFESYHKARREYSDSTLYFKHFWKEFSLAYSTKPYVYKHLPVLAARHILDGYRLELAERDEGCASINLPWIHALMFELGKMMGPKQRLLLVSVIETLHHLNDFSSHTYNTAKTSLVETIFGLFKRKTDNHSGGGITMQLLPLSDEADYKYDYVLILSSKISWKSPFNEESHHISKEHSQTASLCTIISDITFFIDCGPGIMAETVLQQVACYYRSRRTTEDQTSYVLSVRNWPERDSCDLKTHSSLDIKNYKNAEWIVVEENGYSESTEVVTKLREILHCRLTENTKNETRTLSSTEKQLTHTLNLITSEQTVH